MECVLCKQCVRLVDGRANLTDVDSHGAVDRTVELATRIYGVFSDDGIRSDLENVLVIRRRTTVSGVT